MSDENVKFGQMMQTLQYNLQAWYQHALEQNIITIDVFPSNTLIISKYRDIEHLFTFAVDTYDRCMFHVLILDCQFDLLYSILQCNLFARDVRKISNVVELDRIIDEQAHISTMELLQVMYALFVEHAVEKETNFPSIFVSQPAIQNPLRIVLYILNTLPIHQWQPINVTRLLCPLFMSVAESENRHTSDTYVEYARVNFDFTPAERQMIQRLAVQHFQTHNHLHLLLKTFRIPSSTPDHVMERITSIMFYQITLKNVWYVPLVLAWYGLGPNLLDTTFELKHRMDVSTVNTIFRDFNVIEYVRRESIQALGEILRAISLIYTVCGKLVVFPILPADILANVLVMPLLDMEAYDFDETCTQMQNTVFMEGYMEAQVLDYKEKENENEQQRKDGDYNNQNYFFTPCHLTEYLSRIKTALSVNGNSDLYKYGKFSRPLAFPENFIDVFSHLSFRWYGYHSADTPIDQPPGGFSCATQVFLDFEGLTVYQSPDVLQWLLEFFIPFPSLLKLVRYELLQIEEMGTYRREGNGKFGMICDYFASTRVATIIDEYDAQQAQEESDRMAVVDNDVVVSNPNNVFFENDQSPVPKQQQISMSSRSSDPFFPLL